MLFSIYKIGKFIVKKLFNEKEEILTKTKSEIKKENKNKENKVDNLKEKYKKLENINEKINFFIEENIDRYISYKEKNNNLSLEQVIINVNIGLDNKFYTNVKPAPNLDKYNVLVNKYNSLSKDYIPKNLQQIDTKYSIKGMMMVSYAKDAYNKYAKKDGYDAADTYSAKAGFSEHQTGLAIDVYNGSTNYTSFEKTKEFTWMQKNAYKYGFIMRYPKDKEKETGYKYEAWHYRYIGKEIAKYIYDNRITYEEYYVRFIQNN